MIVLGLSVFYVALYKNICLLSDGSIITQPRAICLPRADRSAVDPPFALTVPAFRTEPVSNTTLKRFASNRIAPDGSACRWIMCYDQLLKVQAGQMGPAPGSFELSKGIVDVKASSRSGI